MMSESSPWGPRSPLSLNLGVQSLRSQPVPSCARSCPWNAIHRGEAGHRSALAFLFPSLEQYLVPEQSNLQKQSLNFFFFCFVFFVSCVYELVVLNPSGVFGSLRSLTSWCASRFTSAQWGPFKWISVLLTWPQ